MTRLMGLTTVVLLAAVFWLSAAEPASAPVAITAETSAAEPDATAPAPVAESAAAIGEYRLRAGIVETLRKDLMYLASEELGGRGTGSPEIDLAAEFIAEQFKAAGLEPGGADGSYFQPFSFTYGGSRLGTPTRLSFDLGGEALEVKYGAEFSPHGISSAGKAEAGVVFVGFGLSSKEPRYDDYAGVDVRGKLVVVLRRTPRWDQGEKPFQIGENANAGALFDKAELAAKQGAAAVIFVSDRTLAGEKDPLMEFQRAMFGGGSVAIPVVHLKRAVVDKLLARHGKSLAEIETAINESLVPQSFALEGVTASLEVTIARPQIEAKNVIGTLPGSGPLADEVLVIGAHYDHVGRNEHNNSAAGPSARGKIHFGADDNASGTTGLIELARRFGAIKNRQGRRIVFIAFSGEELGLFGSKHYCNHPVFPLEKTVVMLNMDMIGRSKPVKDDDGAMKDRLVIYGHGTSEGFEKLVDYTNKIFNFKLFKVPGGSGPSDHDSFYKKRIPVLFFFTGTHVDYHKPTDTYDRINYEAMAKVIDMVELFAHHFATMLDKPKFQTTRGGSEDPTDERPRRNVRGMARLEFTPGNYGEEDKGVLVEAVTPDGAADRGGIKAGDFIIEIAGKPTLNMEQYMAAMAGQRPGAELEVVVKRGEEKIKLKVTPAGPAR